jgi:hypothetical protein
VSWRDLKPLDDQWELERPHPLESGGPIAGGNIPSPGGVVTLTFADELSRQWFAEWLRSKRGWAAFTAWVDEKR